ncbi:MAG: hypothetical protein WCO11_06850 [Sphingomonadales bacterium]
MARRAATGLGLAALALIGRPLAAQPAGAAAPEPPAFRQCVAAVPPDHKRWSKRRIAREAHAFIQCRFLAQSEAAVAYLNVRAQYNVMLTNRFPFAPTNHPDLDPDVVRAFFAIHGPLLEPLRNQLQALNLNPDAVAFLTQLLPARTAMTAGAPVPPAYTVTVQFRTDPLRAVGQDQVVEARIGTPTSVAAMPGGPARFTWRPGEPITLRLRWADTAPSVPAAVAADVTGPCQPAPGGPWAQTEFGGDWALLRLLRSQAEAADNPDTATAADGYNVAFDVDLCPNPVRPADGPPPASRARILLRLQISPATAGDGEPARFIALPAFSPLQMPDLWKQLQP